MQLSANLFLGIKGHGGKTKTNHGITTWLKVIIEFREQNINN